MITYLLFVISGMIPPCYVGIAVGETLIVSAENKPLIAIATGTLTTINNHLLAVCHQGYDSSM